MKQARAAANATRASLAQISRVPSALAKDDLDMILDQSAKVLNAQWEASDRLSSRANLLLLAGTSTVAAVIVGFAAESSKFNVPVLGLGFLFFLASIAVSAAAYLVEGFDYRPGLQSMLELATKEGFPQLHWDIALNQAIGFSYNKVNLDRRADLINYGILCFGVAMFIVVLSVIWL